MSSKGAGNCESNNETQTASDDGVFHEIFMSLEPAISKIKSR